MSRCYGQIHLNLKVYTLVWSISIVFVGHANRRSVVLECMSCYTEDNGFDRRYCQKIITIKYATISPKAMANHREYSLSKASQPFRFGVKL